MSGSLLTHVFSNARPTRTSRSLARWAAKFLHLCCAITAFARSAYSFQTQMCHHLRGCQRRARRNLVPTALSFSCIDRWRPSPRWSPPWVRRISHAAAETTCRVAPQKHGRARWLAQWSPHEWILVPTAVWGLVAYARYCPEMLRQ